MAPRQLSSAALAKKGLKYHKSGRLQKAEACYQQLLEREPNNAEVAYLLGGIALQQGNFQKAQEAFDRAVQLDPQNARYLYYLGETHRLKGNLKKAAAAYELATAAQANFPEAWNNWGTVLMAQGTIEMAVKCYERAIEQRPNFTEAHNNLGILYKRQGDLDKATLCYEQALKIDPNSADAYSNWGNVLMLKQEWEQAIRCYRRALQQNPEAATVLSNLGNALLKNGQLQESLSVLRRAVKCDSKCTDAHCNLGNTLLKLGQLEDAIAAYRSFLELRPEASEAAAEVYNNIGNALRQQGDIPSSVEAFKRASEIAPANPVFYSNVLFQQSYSVRLSPADSLAAHRLWEERYRISEPLPYPPAERFLDPKRRLKIAYVSPDFKGDHPVSYFIELIVEHHHRDQVEVFAYSNVHGPDGVTERIKSKSDHWREIKGLSDRAAAELIAKDEIDVLIDLAGHTAYHRLGVFTAKPAPIQATYLGYFTTTGLSQIDYWIVDPVLVPLDSKEQSSEQVWRLNRCWGCYRPADDAPPIDPVVEDPSIITFGSFNNLPKLTPPTLELWAEILEAIPNSQLLLKTKAFSDAATQKRIRQPFEKRGLDPSRILLKGEINSHREHLGLYNLLDIGLDPFPFTGATTTADALWMGVPVISLAGGCMAARQSASLLHTVGLEDWIAYSKEEYLAKAIEFAKNVIAIRKDSPALRQRVADSELCDADNMVAELESAYRAMWQAKIKEMSGN